MTWEQFWAEIGIDDPTYQAAAQQQLGSPFPLTEDAKAAIRNNYAAWMGQGNQIVPPSPAARPPSATVGRSSVVPMISNQAGGRVVPQTPDLTKLTVGQWVPTPRPDGAVIWQRVSGFTEPLDPKDAKIPKYDFSYVEPAPKQAKQQRRVSPDGLSYLDEDDIEHFTPKGERLYKEEQEQQKQKQAQQQQALREQQQAVAAENEARYNAAAMQGKLAQVWATSAQTQNADEIARRNAEATSVAGNRAALGSDYAAQRANWQQQMAARQQNINALASDPAAWIERWKAIRSPAPVEPEAPFAGGRDIPTARNPVEAAQRGYTRWVTPEQLQLAQTGVPMERQQVWDAGTQSYRPEADDEFMFRTQTAPGYKIWQGRDTRLGTIQRTDPQTQSVVSRWMATNPGQPVPGQSAREIALAQVLRSTPWEGVSPANMQVILDTQGASTGISQEQINSLRSQQQQLLEQQGWYGRTNPNTVVSGPAPNPLAVPKPPSAEQWRAWSPTARQAYGMQVAESGENPEDVFQRNEERFTSSRRGQQAVRRY